jgi:superfamily II DNA helicase RecQ
MIQDLSQRRNRIYEELCQVGIKFENQIRKLHDEQPSCEQNPTLQERLIKGVAYFDEHLKDISNGLFDLPFKTDNKTVNDQLADALKQLQESISLKTSCLEACKNGFSVMAYQKTKSVKVIETEKNVKKKIEIKDDVMDKSPLYAELSAWRLQKALDADVPAYTIAHNKTLKAIAQAKPVTLLELKEVQGMGAKKIKQFGSEIIDIVLKFIGEND